MREIAICIFCCIIITSGVASATNIISTQKVNLDNYGVEIVCKNNNISVNPVASVTFIVEITNIGELDDTYEFFTDPMQQIFTTINGEEISYYNPHYISLSSSESKIIEITAEVSYFESGLEYIFLGVYSQFLASNPEAFDWLYLVVNIISDNNPPTSPRGDYQEFSNRFIVWSTDPEGDKIRYGINWTDDTPYQTCTVDYWTDFYDSGEEAIMPYTGKSPYVRITAEDEHGARSKWSPYFSSKSKSHTNFQIAYFLQKINKDIFYQRFQLMQARLLHLLLRRLQLDEVLL